MPILRQRTNYGKESRERRALLLFVIQLSLIQKLWDDFEEIDNISLANTNQSPFDVDYYQQIQKLYLQPNGELQAQIDILQSSDTRSASTGKPDKQNSLVRALKRLMKTKDAASPSEVYLQHKIKTVERYSALPEK
ncbi:unnamed protein product [Hermetia illucens]|uniref:Uncharacterized protein n=1 Tax=Hermetia illucens TaxID=343691 RepID=A0A7R8UQ72_HERIL|nr:unnamed protein product [Hermetia illucens]